MCKSKNEHWNDTRLEEIELCAQYLLTNLDSTSNIITLEENLSIRKHHVWLAHCNWWWDFKKCINRSFWFEFILCNTFLPLIATDKLTKYNWHKWIMSFLVLRQCVSTKQFIVIGCHLVYFPRLTSFTIAADLSNGGLGRAPWQEYQQHAQALKVYK